MAEVWPTQAQQLVEARGHPVQIRYRAEEKPPRPACRTRHWVVERIHPWPNRLRRLLIRWEKKVEDYLAMLRFASAYVAFHTAGLSG